MNASTKLEAKWISPTFLAPLSSRTGMPPRNAAACGSGDFELAGSTVVAQADAGTNRRVFANPEVKDV